MANVNSRMKTLFWQQATLLKRGFSLLEVLVAMTILSVIVLIVANIFQQTGLAWSLGLRRASEQSMVRAVAGAVTRDLSMMVDPAHFVISAEQGGDGGGTVSSSALSAGEITGSAKTSGGLAFWILRPVDDVANSRLENVERELVFVTYSGSGSSVKRTEEVVGGGQSALDPTSFDLGNGSVRFETISGVDFDGYTSVYKDGGLKIVIKPATPATINDYEIAVGSCGPDGKWDTEDDIRSWVEGEDR